MEGDDRDIERLRQLAAEHRARLTVAREDEVIAREDDQAKLTADDEAQRRMRGAVTLAPRLAEQLASKRVPAATFEIVKNTKVLRRHVSEHVVVLRGWTFSVQSLHGWRDHVSVSGFVLASQGTLHTIGIRHVSRMPGAGERYLVATMGHSATEIADQMAVAVPPLQAGRAATAYLRKLESGLAELVARHELEW